jgi:hypothetical protein
VFTNDPQVSAIYLNTTTAVQPGAVQAQTTIIFLAANGTIEGSQQQITSPEPTSRIQSVDVLVCTSTTTLEISTCTINNGNVTSCVPVPAANHPSGASTSTTGGVENYITHPRIVASVLAASAAKAYYDLGNRFPMYDVISPEMIASNIPPLAFLSVETVSDPYSIPQSYVKDVLSGQTAQGLVQGMVSTDVVHTTQQIYITSTFGTSKPALLYIILVLSIACALSCTIASTLKRSVREAAPLDLMRIMAISRNPQLDTVFGPYSDRNVQMDEGMLDAKVGYMWVGGLQRHTLVLSHDSVASGGPVYEGVCHSDMGTASSLNTWTQSRDRFVGYENNTSGPHAL